jgi:GxxExxY protein
MQDTVVNLESAKDPLTGKIVNCAFYVHQQLGPGLLESAYEECLAFMFLKEKLAYSRQVTMPIEFDGNKIDNAYRLDFVVENSVILELKAVEKILPVHEAQMLTYLKLSKIKTGLILNFNSRLMKEGIKRYVI